MATIVKSRKKRAARHVGKYHIGFDLSLTGTGYCVSNAGRTFVVTGSTSSDPKDQIEDRIQSIWNDLKTIINNHADHTSLISIEGIAFGSKGQGRAQLAGLHYYVRIRLREEYPDIPVVIVPPSKLQKFVTGKGRVKKNMMLLQCYKKFKFEADDDNICDAFCLVRYTHDKHKK